jgi:hypothetical protein
MNYFEVVNLQKIVIQKKLKRKEYYKFDTIVI